MNFKDKIFVSLANTLCPKLVNKYKQDCIQEARESVTEELQRMSERMLMYHQKEEYLEKENQYLKRALNIQQAQSKDKSLDMQKSNNKETDYSKLFD